MAEASARLASVLTSNVRRRSIEQSVALFDKQLVELEGVRAHAGDQGHLRRARADMDSTCALAAAMAVAVRRRSESR
ncbi:hypothetical protein ACU4GD_17795 [Cupriavidus basilensis]